VSEAEARRDADVAAAALKVKKRKNIFLPPIIRRDEMIFSASEDSPRLSEARADLEQPARAILSATTSFVRDVKIDRRARDLLDLIHGKLPRFTSSAWLAKGASAKIRAQKKYGVSLSLGYLKNVVYTVITKMRLNDFLE